VVGRMLFKRLVVLPHTLIFSDSASYLYP
jgi:hypothetical protein